MRKLLAFVALLIVVGIAVAAVVWLNKPHIGKVKDEALAHGRDAASFPAADEDYFHDMDGATSTLR